MVHQPGSKPVPLFRKKNIIVNHFNKFLHKNVGAKKLLISSKHQIHVEFVCMFLKHLFYLCRYICALIVVALMDFSACTCFTKISYIVTYCHLLFLLLLVLLCILSEWKPQKQTKKKIKFSTLFMSLRCPISCMSVCILPQNKGLSFLFYIFILFSLLFADNKTQRQTFSLTTLSSFCCSRCCCCFSPSILFYCTAKGIQTVEHLLKSQEATQTIIHAAKTTDTETDRRTDGLSSNLLECPTSAPN